jgi:flagellar hook-associated protein 2
MSSPITLSGFNNVDFGLIIDAILEQERAPIRTLELARSGQQKQLDAYGALSARAASLGSAVSPLARETGFDVFKTSVADSKVLLASAGAGATPGTHTITVSTLAKAQVLTSTSLTATQDTVVASSGSFTLGGTTFDVSGDTTLAQLRDQINASSAAPARASLVDTGSGYRLVLTAKQTGTAGAFTVTNSLAGGSGINFADGDADGQSGDTASDNAVNATDASLVVDGVTVVRSSNVVDGALPGVSLTLTSEGATTTVSVSRDVESLRGKIESLVRAFNDFSGFLRSQSLVGSNGQRGGALASDPLARSLNADLRALLRSSVATGGAYTHLAEIGVVFESTGELTIDAAKLDRALAEKPQDVAKLFGASGIGVGARIDSLLSGYLGASGLLASAENRLEATMRSLDVNIAAVEERLVLREQELRLQFAAADKAISTLNAQVNSLRGIAR